MRLAFTSPVSSATRERSFLATRRVKKTTYEENSQLLNKHAPLKSKITRTKPRNLW